MVNREKLLFGTLVCFAAGVVTPAARAGREKQPVRYDKQTMSEPRLIHKVAPQYPEGAKQERVEGIVILDAVIAEDGSIRATSVEKGEDARLVEAARNAVGQWRYEPVRDEGGEPMELVFTVTIRFKLAGE